MSIRISNDGLVMPMPPPGRDGATRVPPPAAQRPASAPSPDEGTARLSHRNALDHLDRARLADALLSGGRGGDVVGEIEALATEDHHLAGAAALARAGDLQGARAASAEVLRAAEVGASGNVLAAANVTAAAVGMQDADVIAQSVARTRDALMNAGPTALAAQANQSSERVAGLLG